jgi:predicted Zn-dependent peptidase
MAWISEYFGGIPPQPQPPRADVTEPRQERKKRVTKSDPKATRPALGIAYHEPPPETDAYYAFALIHQILASGRDGWLYADLVRKRALTGDVDATMNSFDSMFDSKGPALYIIALYHDADRTDDEIVKAIDADIDRLRLQPLDAATLERARVKARSAFYKDLESGYGFGRADLLAVFALFYDDPTRINRIESRFAAVTPELIRKTAEEYLRPGNRTILTIVPKTAGAK